MKKITADIIVTNIGAPLSNHYIILDEYGKIYDILPIEERDTDIEKFDGVLVPGYINAHCHLELSHLQGVIPTGTGLIPFIRSILALRDFPKEDISEAILAADQEMWQNGIVAVGDISNTIDTIAAKESSRMRYHTFVEFFDLFQHDQTDQFIAQYQKVYDAYDSGLHKKSLVPHAPYSVSPGVFDHISQKNESGRTVSVHNQETEAENDLFLSKKGELVDFYNGLGMSLDAFSSTGKRSISYLLEHLDPGQRTLFVHNTTSTTADIEMAMSWSPQTYWATCPNANLYIENRLPDYKAFIKTGATMCIGTDSLSSNWELSVFEEMKTIKKYQSTIPDIDIIRWATANGAEALGFGDLGSLKVGTSPGLNLIDVDVVDGVFDLSKARSTRKLA